MRNEDSEGFFGIYCFFVALRVGLAIEAGRAMWVWAFVLTLLLLFSFFYY